MNEYKHLERALLEEKALQISNTRCKGKGKAIPLQALTGPQGSRRLRNPDFKKIET
jgi:hypothetical protein